MKRWVALAGVVLVLAASPCWAGGVFGSYGFGRGGGGHGFGWGIGSYPGYYSNQGYYGHPYSPNPVYGYNGPSSWYLYDANHPYTSNYSYNLYPNTSGDYRSSYYTPSNAAASSTATVDVRVPADAQLLFDGEATRQQGRERHFSTPPLQPGKDYAYTITARWKDDNGKTIERTRTAEMHAGTHVTIDFLSR